MLAEIRPSATWRREGSSQLLLVSARSPVAKIRAMSEQVSMESRQLFEHKKGGRKGHLVLISTDRLMNRRPQDFVDQTKLAAKGVVPRLSSRIKEVLLTKVVASRVLGATK